jgi:hypothetical protein
MQVRIHDRPWGQLLNALLCHAPACKVSGCALMFGPTAVPPVTPSAAYTIQIQRALGPAGAGDTALFFGTLGAATALAMAPVLAALHLTGVMDLSGVAAASLGLACLNGEGAHQLDAGRAPPARAADMNTLTSLALGPGSTAAGCRFLRLSAIDAHLVHMSSQRTPTLTHPCPPPPTPGLLDYVLADYLWARAVLLLGPTPATLGLSIQVPIATALDVALGRPAWLKGPRPAALTLGGSALILGGFVCITAAGAAPRALPSPAAGADEDGMRGGGEGGIPVSDGLATPSGQAAAAAAPRAAADELL